MKTMGIVFANIYDSSLGQLTNKRTIASLPFGGRYRQIDFCLSNMANSAIDHIGIITKYNYQSLMNHIGSGQEWDLELGEGEMEFLTPFAMGHNSSYRGKLEALASAMDFLELANEEYVVLADSGVLCAIDFRKVVNEHIASGRDVTIVTKAGISNGKKQLDLAVLVDENGNVRDMAVDYAADERYLASMGIFIMKRELLIDATRHATSRGMYHLERDFILRAFYKGELNVGVYCFQNVALFNESTEEYYKNNLALLDEPVRRSLFRSGSTIYTKVRNEVPAYFGENAEIDNCIVGDGCVLDGTAEHSVLFRGVNLNRGAHVRDCVIMQDAIIEEGAELECCVLDKNVHVRKGAKLRGTPRHPMIIERGETI
jgi:glucose-1-phosphate adenylyltransferase